MAELRTLEIAGERPILSVVVPIYNDADNIDVFLERVEKVLNGLAQSYEIVCVDDGSGDGTLPRLLDHRRRNPAIKILSLSRNFGKDVALTAGLDHSRGQAVTVLDVDLQDPPEVIPELYAKWRDGFDVVYARRGSREGDSAAKRFTAHWFYRIHNAVADVSIPADTGDFRLMDRRVVEALRRLPERNRFMKVLFSWVGFRQTGVDYRRAPRVFGSSKWRYWRLWNFALDGITSSSTLPLRIWSYLGAAISLVAIGFAIWLVVRTFIHGIDVPGYASLMVAVLFMGGINLFTLGVIGEYLGRIYMESKGRPLYLVREAHGLEQSNPRDQAWSATSINAWPSSSRSTGGS
jgi:glycosyltransferase involved in cell wall biosynthesis